MLCLACRVRELTERRAGRSKRIPLALIPPSKSGLLPPWLRRVERLSVVRVKLRRQGG